MINFLYCQVSLHASLLITTAIKLCKQSNQFHISPFHHFKKKTSGVTGRPRLISQNEKTDVNKQQCTRPPEPLPDLPPKQCWFFFFFFAFFRVSGWNIHKYNMVVHSRGWRLVDCGQSLTQVNNHSGSSERAEPKAVDGWLGEWVEFCLLEVDLRWVKFACGRCLFPWCGLSMTQHYNRPHLREA